MNAKKAKALRRAARDLAQRGGIPEDTQLMIHRKTGVVTVGRCERGLLRHMKKKLAKGQISLLKRPVVPAP
jgi:hypothetical protein